MDTHYTSIADNLTPGVLVGMSEDSSMCSLLAFEYYEKQQPIKL